ncbi:MAG: nicotinate-nucleotide adenylyltransferase [Thioalkalivibrionaceae bacterium]
MIGVMGGTFDPVHFGHLRPATEIAEWLELDCLHWIPVNVPPHRARPMTPAFHRLAMVECALAGASSGARMVADRRELDRAGPSYTVDTLASLRREIGPDAPLVLMMGMDAFTGFRSWHRWPDILDQTHLVVAHRPGSPAAEELDDELAERFVQSPNALRTSRGGLIALKQVTQLDISSTRIRSLLRQGRNPRYLLPDAVLDYIHDHRLFSAS